MLYRLQHYKILIKNVFICLTTVRKILCSKMPTLKQYCRLTIIIFHWQNTNLCTLELGLIWGYNLILKKNTFSQFK